MYLRKHTDKRIGKTYLSIARGYRNEQGKTRTAVVEYLGELEELQKQYSDPIAHFKSVVEQMNVDEKAKNQSVVIEINKGEHLSLKGIPRKNFGYAVLSKIYHELGIDYFLKNKFKHNKINETNINNIMKLLVFSRLLCPASKKATYENKDMFFENSDFSLKELYNSLSYISSYKNELQKYVYNNIKDRYGNNTDTVYYDVTNYYFEIDEPDELRKKGVSKEHRPNPIVQMGLLMDTLGMPMAYRLFPGNTNDCQTLLPVLSEVKESYELGKIIVVADKGLNTSDNIAYNIIKGNGYVYSQSIRGGNKELKKYVLDQTNYKQSSDEYRCKSRIYPREITVEDINGKKKKLTIDEKQVVFYSRDYDKRAKAERQPAIDKANELIKNTAKFNKANSYGAAKYVKHLVFDKETGEIIKAQSHLSIDEDKLREEEQFDGYYAIVSSELQKTDSEIIEIYRGLWRIEESFKITKSTLESRPVYLSRQDRIESHFLICYLSLVISRILQYRMNNEFSVQSLLCSIGKISCSHVQENYYIFDYVDEITIKLGEVFGIDFTMKFMSLKQIKNILANTKIRST